MGAGGDHALTDILILRGEYRYRDFGSTDHDLANGVVYHDLDLATHDARLGIAYKF